MELTINPLVLATEAPPIPIAQAWKARYKGEFGPLIDLSQAVPGHPPPKSLLGRLGEAASQPEASRYGPIVGDLALREALAADISDALRRSGRGRASGDHGRLQPSLLRRRRRPSRRRATRSFCPRPGISTIR